MCFKDGWKMLVKENMVRENDFMFLRFSVRIFEDGSRCDKILPLHVGGNL